VCTELTGKEAEKRFCRRMKKQTRRVRKDVLRFLCLLLEEIFEICPARDRRQFAKSGKDSEEAVGVVALRFTTG